MFGEERGQDESRAGGFHVRDGKPGQLAAAGQVTHGEDRRVNAVDRTWGFDCGRRPRRVRCGASSAVPG